MSKKRKSNRRKYKQNKAIRYREKVMKIPTTGRNQPTIGHSMDFTYVDQKLKFWTNSLGVLLVLISMPCLVYLTFIPESWLDKMPFSFYYVIAGTILLAIAVIGFATHLVQAPNHFFKKIAWLKKGNLTCHEDGILLTLNGIEHNIKFDDINKYSIERYYNNPRGGLSSFGAYFRIVTKQKTYCIYKSTIFDKEYIDIYKVGMYLTEFLPDELVQINKQNKFESKKGFIITTIIALLLAGVIGYMARNQNMDWGGTIIIGFIFFILPYLPLIILIVGEDPTSKEIYKRVGKTPL